MYCSLNFGLWTLYVLNCYTWQRSCSRPFTCPTPAQRPMFLAPDGAHDDSLKHTFAPWSKETREGGRDHP